MLQEKVSEILTKIINEIEQWDPEMFPINTKPQCEHEQELATVEDVVLKKIHQLHLFYAREASHNMADLSIEHDNEEMQKQYARNADKAELLKVLFWHLTAEKYELWGESETGIRKGWSIVKTHRHGPPEIFRQLFGGR